RAVVQPTDIRCDARVKSCRSDERADAPRGRHATRPNRSMVLLSSGRATIKKANAMKKITRRRFLQYGVVGGAAFLLLVRVGSHSVLAQVPGGTLPPGSIPKYTTPLVIPPAMPRTSTLITPGGKATD